MNKKRSPRNKWERKIYNQLKRNKAVFGYECAKFPYKLEKTYLCDFTITTKSGIIIHVEVKGYLRPEDRVKLLAVRECNPTLDLRVVFQRNDKVSRRSKTKYSEWAEKNGFKWAVGRIPKEWLNE